MNPTPDISLRRTKGREGPRRDIDPPSAPQIFAVGSEHVVSRQGTTDTLERKLTHGPTFTASSTGMNDMTGHHDVTTGLASSNQGDIESPSRCGIVEALGFPPQWMGNDGPPPSAQCDASAFPPCGLGS